MISQKVHAPASYHSYHSGRHNMSLHLTYLILLLPAGTEEHHIRTGMEPGHGMGTTGTGMGHHGTGVTGMGTGMGTHNTGLGTAGMGHHGAGHGMGTTGAGYDPETGKETMTHKIKKMITGRWLYRSVRYIVETVAHCLADNCLMICIVMRAGSTSEQLCMCVVVFSLLSVQLLAAYQARCTPDECLAGCHSLCNDASSGHS